MKWPLGFLNGSGDGPRLRELKSMRLFKQLTPRELREAEELLHERSYEKGEIIFDEGDTGLGLFIVVSGRVKAYSSHSALQQLAPEFCCGDFFGELSLFDESLRTARVVAIEPSRVVALFRTEFFSLLERNKSIGVKILFELSRAVCERARNLALAEPKESTREQTSSH
jgi:CRP/FNR family transcriptional regulator, cyclic AMP receptor protein